MVRNLLKFVAALSLCTICAAPLARAQEERDLSAEQTRAFHAGKPRPESLSIMTLLDRADATYALGETLRLAVKSNEDAYVTVFNIGASGKVTQLFPNGYQTNNRIKAGETIEVPSKSSESRIKVTGPVGIELIKVVATSKPITIIPDAHFQSGGGLFKTLTEGSDGLDRDLQVVSANQPSEFKVATAHQVIKTVQSRPGGGAASTGGALVIPSVGVLVPAKPTASDHAQRFPLLLAVDKPSYRTSEVITMAVTALKSCYLTVIGTDAAGRTRRLYPTAALPAKQISGMQTLMLSGGTAPQTLVAGKPGKETVRAVCTTEAREGAGPVRSDTDELSAEEKQAFERDLTVVSSRPAGSIGYTEVTFGVVK
ncbi:DUF4384 domain-containing protein [Bradyrhizobium cenepequi]